MRPSLSTLCTCQNQTTFFYGEIFCVYFLGSGELSIQVAVEMPFDIKSVESPTHKIKMKVTITNNVFTYRHVYKCTYKNMHVKSCIYVIVQKTATMATVELCPDSVLGSGFTLLVGLSEIHVPRMWVEEDSTGHHVSTTHTHTYTPSHSPCPCTGPV